MRTAAGEEEATLEDRVRIGVEFIETGCGKNPINIDSVHVPERITNLRACVDESRVERVETAAVPGCDAFCGIVYESTVMVEATRPASKLRLEFVSVYFVIAVPPTAGGAATRKVLELSSRTIGGARVPSRPVKIGTLKPRPL